MPWRYDEAELRLDGHERLANGWMRVDAVIGKANIINTYTNPDGTVRLEARLEEEVFAPASMASFEGVPLTDGHPRDIDGRGLLLDAKNTRRFARGSVSNIRRDGDLMLGTILVTDEESVEGILAGKLQISPGYRLRSLDRSVREFQSQRVDGAQRGIVGNHFAHLLLGRQGSEVAIRLDGDDRAAPSIPVITINTPPGRGHAMKIMIGGVEYEVDDKVGSAYLHQQQRLDALEQEASKNKTRTDAAEVARIEGERDTERARADAAEGDKQKLQARFDALASDFDKYKAEQPAKMASRIDLLANARLVCGDGYSQFGEARTDDKGVTAQPVKTDIEVMTDVVLAVVPDAKDQLKANAASEGYVRARYDMALEQWTKSKNHGKSVLDAARRAGSQRTDSRDGERPPSVKPLTQQVYEAAHARQEGAA